MVHKSKPTCNILPYITNLIVVGFCTQLRVCKFAVLLFATDKCRLDKLNFQVVSGFYLLTIQFCHHRGAQLHARAVSHVQSVGKNVYANANLQRKKFSIALVLSIGF